MFPALFAWIIDNRTQNEKIPYYGDIERLAWWDGESVRKA
jgi:hypothetical protein